jgi:hypothetical protein
MTHGFQGTVGGHRESLLRFLGQHYGDRSVYLSDARDRELLREAVGRGLVSPAGRLTSIGYALWQSVR